jgi:hypothetical protein
MRWFINDKFHIISSHLFAGHPDSVEPDFRTASLTYRTPYQESS